MAYETIYCALLHSIFCVYFVYVVSMYCVCIVYEHSGTDLSLLFDAIVFVGLCPQAGYY